MIFKYGDTSVIIFICEEYNFNLPMPFILLRFLQVCYSSRLSVCLSVNLCITCEIFDFRKYVIRLVCLPVCLLFTLPQPQYLRYHRQIDSMAWYVQKLELVHWVKRSKVKVTKKAKNTFLTISRIQTW